MGAQTALGKKIEEAVLSHLVENGSFSTEEIFDAVIFSDRKFRRILNSLNKNYPEFEVAAGYESSLRQRIRRQFSAPDKNGDRIFVGIPAVDGKGTRAGVRYVMRMDATPEQLRKAGYNTLAMALNTLKRGVHHVVSANYLLVDDVESLRDYGDDYDSMNEMARADANAVVALVASTDLAPAIGYTRAPLKLEGPKE